MKKNHHRALLLDYHAYARARDIAYSPCSAHAITYADLAACGAAQGIDIRPVAQGGHVAPGTILLVRSGWVAHHYAAAAAAGSGEREQYALRPHDVDPAASQQQQQQQQQEQQYAGLAQEEDVLTWLHDCYFAAVGGDAPTFEVWPSKAGYYLHEYVLALWGMPIGEMVDLERVAEVCAREGRWWFFFTSAVNHCVGGVGSHVNGSAIF